MASPLERKSMRNIGLLLVFIGAMTMSVVAASQTVYRTSDIALLDNRFRVDHGIKQITFIIARERFSKAVILVRPDGSKIYIWDKSERIHWLEGKEHDIITIENPMPGPWQALGKIQGDNRIQLLSDVQLQVNHLPIQLYSGERLKVTGSLLHLQQTLNGAFLRDTELIITAHGYHQTEDANFNFSSQQLTKFNDKGESYDELPEDGIFTSFLKLDLDSGKYKFEVAVKNNVFTRSFNQDVVIFPRPITTQMLPLLIDEQPQLKFTFDIEELQPESIVIKGRLVAVKGDLSDDFIVYGEANTDEQIYTFERPENIGSYKIELLLFATTQAGREIIINIPSQAFVIAKPIIIDSALIAAAATSDAVATSVVESEAETKWNLLLWIVGGLLVVLLLAVITLFSIKFWQKRKFEKVIAKQANTGSNAQQSDELDMSIDLGLNSTDK